jgi:hypothetical protein
MPPTLDPRHAARTSRRPARLRRAWLIAVSAVIGALFIAPSASAASAKDPVVAAIDRAVASTRITPEDGRRLRLDWNAAARAQRTASTVSRRASVAAVRSYTTNLARSGGLTPDRVRPVLLSVRATTWTMLNASTFPSHEQELQVPGEVVVFTYYYGRGVQFQPFETFKQGLRELNTLKPDVEAARAIADRMLELSVRSGTSLTWEYYFPFGGPSRPWTSAISQAVATEFLHRVGDYAPEAERAPYLDAAEAVTRSFLRGTSVGGVSVEAGTGSFYVMYPFNPSQRILNGHLQALLNVNRYATATGSVAARRVVDRGLAGILPLLPKFDTGAWSNYQPGQEAELGYHELQTDQLRKLGEELGNPVLAEYGERFDGYLVTPPTITLPSALYVAIFPAADQFRDTVDVPVTIDKRARITLVVRDEVGVEVNRMSIVRGRGAHSITWDGTTASGARASAGNYVGELTSTDIVGNRATKTLDQPLRVVADQTAPVLRLVTMRERGTKTLVTAGAFDMGSGWITAQLRIDGDVVASVRGPRSGTSSLLVRRPIADVQRGELVLRDTSGNELVHALGAPAT